MNVLTRWTTVTKTVTMMTDHTHVHATLASHLMLMRCTVMVMAYIYSKKECIHIIYHTLDIDECTTGSAECNQQCQNTIGDYYCTCYGPGYQLQQDNSTCLSKLTVVQTIL